MKGLAIVTGADGGMGRVISLTLAKAGYKIIMASLSTKSAQVVCNEIKSLSKNEQIKVYPLNLASFSSIVTFADKIKKEGEPICLLMNNAGILNHKFEKTENGLEKTVSVNYVGPYLLTRLLLPLMNEGSRIINTVSCTYIIGKIPFHFFEKGRDGQFLRIPVYSNTKLALLWFTLELADLMKKRGIMVNAVDPGIVNTNIITMHAWFDLLTDIFFRPFIRTPEQGAKTALYLALSDEVKKITGCCFANNQVKKIPSRLLNRTEIKRLWRTTEEKVKPFLK